MSRIPADVIADWTARINAVTPIRDIHDLDSAVAIMRKLGIFGERMKLGFTRGHMRTAAAKIFPHISGWDDTDFKRPPQMLKPLRYQVICELGRRHDKYAYLEDAIDRAVTLSVKWNMWHHVWDSETQRYVWSNRLKPTYYRGGL